VYPYIDPSVQFLFVSWQWTHTLNVAVFGSIAVPLSADPAQRPEKCAPDHTHKWTVFVRGVDGQDITYWLKKVQFKLHETYAHPLRMVEAPDAFEVTETGWGEFEVGIKMTFVPESGEKPTSVYHQLKLHPYGEDKEGQKERGETIVSQNYEEIVFNEPAEAFYQILTNAQPAPARGKAGGKNAKAKKQQDRTAEIPHHSTATNPYSQDAEGKEIDQLVAARKELERLIQEERDRLVEQEKRLEELRKSEGIHVKK
jgi:YEATS domain-containing protein 4